MHSVLDLHQVRRHAKRIVLQVAVARFAPTGIQTRSKEREKEFYQAETIWSENAALPTDEQ